MLNLTKMRSKVPTIIITTIFALFHIIVVAIPVVTSGGSGETQGFATALFDFPIAWLLGLFPAGRGILHGSSQALYVLIFSAGGTLMYCVAGAVIGHALQSIIRAFRAS